MNRMDARGVRIRSQGTDLRFRRLALAASKSFGLQNAVDELNIMHVLDGMANGCYGKETKVTQTQGQRSRARIKTTTVFSFAAQVSA
jgi:hypothetical protein